MPQQEAVSELCKYEFTEEEKKKFSLEMANKLSELKELDEQKRAILSELKSRTDGFKSDISIAARRIKDGYEMKYMDCYVKKDFDNNKVLIVRIDNAEIVKERLMTDDDRQMELKEDKEGD